MAEPAPIPRLKPGLDLTKLKLSLEEGYIASRVDGRTNVAELALIVGKPLPEMERIVTRLVKAGVLLFGEASAPNVTTSGAEKADYGDYIFPPGLMAEEVDLSLEEKKRVVYVHEHLATWTHYELLDCKRRDDAKAIKSAYFLRSKEWHPDRFRRPRLGSFKKLIEEVFQAVKNAYDVLSDEEARAVYDEDIIFAPDEEDMAEMLDRQRRQEREKVREEEALERRRRRNPLRKRLGQAKEVFEEALAKEKAGELLPALRLAQTAATFDPRPEHLEAVERLKLLAGDLRVGPYLRRGAHFESMTQWEQAIQAYQDAVKVSPENAQARLRLAYNLLMGGRDPHEAASHATKAAAKLSEDPEAHFILGMCYEKGGLEKAALRAYGRALELRPTYVEVKKRLKKLKWGFLG